VHGLEGYICGCGNEVYGCGAGAQGLQGCTGPCVHIPDCGIGTIVAKGWGGPDAQTGDVGGAQDGTQHGADGSDASARQPQDDK